MGIPVSNLGSIGVSFDMKGHQLPPNAWTNGRNCRFIDDSVFSSLGHRAILGIPRISPYHVHATLDSTLSPVFAYLGLTDAWATDGTTHAEITRVAGDYTGTIDNLWNASDFGEFTIFNNGIDLPQSWGPRSLGTPLVNLANWPTNYRAKVFRTFRRFIFALDVTIDSNRFPQLIKWSDEADPGTLPTTWDPADETNSAGEYSLTDKAGQLIDALPLGDIFFIYTADATYVARYIGGTFIFDLPLQFRDFGVLAQRCIGEWRKKHIVLSNDYELHINDGFQYTSLIDKTTRRWLQNRVDSTNFFRSFIAINQTENEAWTCFPESGNTWPNIALITNLKTGASIPRDIPDLTHIDYNRGPSEAPTTFDSISTPFDSMIGYFDQGSRNSTKKVLIGCSPLVNRNIVLQSDDMDTTWTKTNVTVTVDQDANVFTGGNTLDKVIASAGVATHSVSQVRTKLAEAKFWQISVVAKQAGVTQIELLLRGDSASHQARAMFDLTNGSLVSSSMVGNFSSLLTQSTDLGDGSYRLFLGAVTDADTNIEMHLQLASGGNSSFNGNGTDGVLLGSAQLREGLFSVAYQATTTIQASSAIWLMDSGQDFDGVAFTAFVERESLVITGQNLNQSLRVDPSKNHLFCKLFPKVEIQNGTYIDISAGGQSVQNGSQLLTTEQFFPETQLWMDVDRECRYPYVKFSASDRQMFRLTEYDPEIYPIGLL